MIALETILVATDFSEPSDAALAYGRELARTFGASLTLLHVVDNLASRGFGADGFSLATPDLQDQLEAQSKAHVDAQLFDNQGNCRTLERCFVSNFGARDGSSFANVVQNDLAIDIADRI